MHPLVWHQIHVRPSQFTIYCDFICLLTVINWFQFSLFSATFLQPKPYPTVDASEIPHQLRLVVEIPWYIYTYIPLFFASQAVFRTINSMIHTSYVFFKSTPNLDHPSGVPTNLHISSCLEPMERIFRTSFWTELSKKSSDRTFL